VVIEVVAHVKLLDFPILLNEDIFLKSLEIKIWLLDVKGSIWRLIHVSQQ